MSIIFICYTTCSLSTQTVAPTLPGFQGIKPCFQYLASHPYKPMFISLFLVMAQISSDLHVVGIKLKTAQPRIMYNAINLQIMLEFSTEEG